MSSEVDQASLQPREGDSESQNESQGIVIIIDVGQVILNLKQLKSFEILKSAFTIFANNIKFMLLMMFSIAPLFLLMVFLEIKLQKAIDAAPKSLETFHTIHFVALSDGSISRSYDYPDDDTNERRVLLSDILQLCVFYVVFYPLLELFTVIITLKIAAKVHAGEKQATVREVLYHKKSLKGPFITCLCVHLLSNLTLLALVWVVANHLIFSSRFNLVFYDLKALDSCLNIFFTGFHSVIFVALLYKYLDWSAFWNMGMVISVLEDETWVGALVSSGYYGKHCKKTGFELMLVFFAFAVVLRLPCLYAGLCNASVAGVLITCVVIGLVCLGNLVKWVAFVLYFYDCKQQTMEKKIDEELGNAVNAS